jgi:hypothetical protein
MMIHSRFFVLCLKQKIILALFLIFWLSILEGWVLLTGMELIFHLWQKLAIHDEKGKIFYLMQFCMRFMCFVWMSWMRIIPKRNLGPCPQHFSWFQIDILARNEMIQGSSWSHYTCLQVLWWSKVPLDHITHACKYRDDPRFLLISRGHDCRKCDDPRYDFNQRCLWEMWWSNYIVIVL